MVTMDTINIVHFTDIKNFGSYENIASLAEFSKRVIQ